MVDTNYDNRMIVKIDVADVARRNAENEAKTKANQSQSIFAKKDNFQYPSINASVLKPQDFKAADYVDTQLKSSYAADCLVNNNCDFGNSTGSKVYNTRPTAEKPIDKKMAVMSAANETAPINAQQKWFGEEALYNFEEPESLQGISDKKAADAMPELVKNNSTSAEFKSDGAGLRPDEALLSINDHTPNNSRVKSGDRKGVLYSDNQRKAALDVRPEDSHDTKSFKLRLEEAEKKAELMKKKGIKQNARPYVAPSLNLSNNDLTGPRPAVESLAKTTVFSDRARVNAK
jgi:hypothetical protein